LSRNFITTLLRDELGFDGLVITDDLEMGAIVKNYGIGEACKMAVDAGVDMLAICADPERIREGYDSILQAVESGEITEDRIDRSLERIAALKHDLSEPVAFDPERLRQLSDQVAALNESLNLD
ncbi:MAG TPA: glycoside hydrolase family 3 N-terminal domain-containing protein, partial [Pyrinomonadaceae bacterium]|nr:glycoside hydrolase family 3 N-terminal domain-containing protein [Pyrinomonadaceae bacterium]